MKKIIKKFLSKLKPYYSCFALILLIMLFAYIFPSQKDIIATIAVLSGAILGHSLHSINDKEILKSNYLKHSKSILFMLKHQISLLKLLRTNPDIIDLEEAKITRKQILLLNEPSLINVNMSQIIEDLLQAEWEFNKLISSIKFLKTYREAYPTPQYGGKDFTKYNIHRKNFNEIPKTIKLKKIFKKLHANLNSTFPDEVFTNLNTT